MRDKKGQSILEYVIVLIAIVAAVGVGAAALTKNNKVVGIGKLMNETSNVITNSTKKIGDIGN